MKFKIFILTILIILTGIIIWLFYEIRQNEIERKRLEESVTQLWQAYEYYHHNSSYDWHWAKGDSVGGPKSDYIKQDEIK